MSFYSLKKLISTHYEPTTLFFNEKSFKMEYIGKGEPVKLNLEDDGDFRSEECVELLKESDIVVTNPPFSLFTEYLNQLISFKKKFLVMGNIHAVANKKIRPHFVNNKTWLGCSISGGDREFMVPNDYPLVAANTRIEGGKKFIRVKGIRWFTNLPHKKRNEQIILCKKYDPKLYPKYENYNAIEVTKVNEIPEEYSGEMGVPITFLDKFNPEQFEIIGFDRDLEKLGGGRINERFKLSGKEKFARIIIKIRK